MRYTVKCPNCGTENESGDIFCTGCGVKLSGSAVSDVDVHKHESVKTEPAGKKYCSLNPEEHIIDDPSLGFCPVCGSVLTDAPAVKKKEIPSLPAAKRYCKNGHCVMDPELVFCPECGLPLDEETKESDTTSTIDTWKCECGQVNLAIDRFCVSCCKERNMAKRVRKPVVAEPVIPDGMYIPSDADLKRKY